MISVGIILNSEVGTSINFEPNRLNQSTRVPKLKYWGQSLTPTVITLFTANENKI